MSTELFSEADVIEVLDDVLVTEERYRENSDYYLTKEQVIIELTNLLLETYKGDVHSHVNTYRDMMLNKHQSYDEEISKKCLYPAVEYDKIEYYHDSDFNPDPEHEKKNQVKFVEFVAFLNQLHSLLKSKEGGYDGVNKRLDKLFTPFIANGDASLVTTDAFRQNAAGEYEYAKIVQGDAVNVSGFFTRASNPVVKPFSTFDWSQYSDEISSMKIGDDVHINFNDFVMTNKRTLYDTTGKVIKIQEDSIYIKTDNGTTYTYKLDHSDPVMFIFPVKTTNYKFSKLDLLKNAVYIKGVPKQSSHVLLPTKLTEILYLVMYVIQRDALNFKELYKAIYKVFDVRHLTLHQSVSDSLRRIMDVRYPKLTTVASIPKFTPPPVFQVPSSLRNVKVPEDLSQSFGDTNLQRYKLLHQHLENEQIHLLKIFESYIKRRSNDDDLEQVLRRMQQKQPSTLDKENACQSKTTIVVAKRYETLEDLQRDSGKKLYFDKDLDPTNYKTTEDEVREAFSRDVNKTTKDIDFEIKTLQTGKRRVRENDCCILMANTLYVWRKVQGNGMWVKKRKYPFKICADDLMRSDMNDDVCVYDMYVDVCKTLKHVRKNIEHTNHMNKVKIINDLIDFSVKKDEFLELIKKDMFDLHMRQQRTSEVSIKASLEAAHHDVDDDTFYENGEDPLANGEGILAYEDQNHYAVMYGEQQKKPAESNIVSPVCAFVDMLLTFMDLKISPFDVENIRKKVDAYTQKHQNIQEGLEKERKRLSKSIDSNKYESNQPYRIAVDKLVSEKLGVFQEKAYSDMYYEIALHSVSMISLVVMSKYPKVVLQSIYPSCVRFMSYQRLDESISQKGINKYITCLVKGITSGADGKYDKIQSKNIDEMTKDVNKIMDLHLQTDANLKLRLESNRENLVNAASKHTDKKKFNHSFVGFKPSPELFKDKEGRQYNNPVASSLKTMNKIIKKSKHLKISTANIPMLINACCLEKLDDVRSYYDFFGADVQMVREHTKLMKANNVVVPMRSSEQQKSRDQFMTGRIVYSDDTTRSLSPYEYNDTRLSIESIIEELGITTELSHDTDAFWDDFIFPSTLDTFTIVKEVLMQSYDGCDSQLLDNFRPVLIMIRDVGDMDTVRQCLYHHLTVNMPRTLSTVICKKVPENDWRMSLFNNNMIDLSQWKRILNKDIYKAMFIEEDVTKNISLLSYVYVKCMYELISYIVTGKADATESDIRMSLLTSPQAQKDVHSLMARYIYEDIALLLDTIVLNDVDAGSVRQRVEELREKRKQELIGMYKIDDEERQLQMTLRKIGVDTWYDVGEVEEKDVYAEDDVQQSKQTNSIMKTLNQREEDENYSMSGYQGENADADEVYEDFASAHMFSPDI